jgi:hypothetical protein
MHGLTGLSIKISADGLEKKTHNLNRKDEL